LTAADDVLRARAEQLAAATGGEVVAATARVGGGALPLLELPGPVVALPDASLAAALRGGEPPVVGRVERGRLLLDPRTLSEAELPQVAEAVRRALTDHLPRGAAGTEHR
ncbi:MAG TPA: hypothetical protein VFG79_18535, partial [Solirubrobacter sp.]|nr:hypothetical protein [Solirubrobacter sp.]